MIIWVVKLVQMRSLVIFGQHQIGRHFLKLNLGLNFFLKLLGLKRLTAHAFKQTGLRTMGLVFEFKNYLN